MAYYMRYLMTDPQDITLPLLADVLQQVDAAYTIEQTPDAAFIEAGLLKYGETVLGDIEINRADDELFADEINALHDELYHELPSEGLTTVLATLKQAVLLLAVEVMWEGDDEDTALQRLDPLWDWLLANRAGLLQSDGEGYYDRRGTLILEV